MMLSTTATHALRALTVLAADDGVDAVQGRDLAGRIGVPAHYLSKILAVLARRGILAATPGARGGYRLDRAPGAITLYEIIEPFEGKRLRPGCLLRPHQPCGDDDACPAHEGWAEVKTAFSRFLETTRLADIRGEAPEVKRSRARRRRGRGVRPPAARPPPGRFSRLRRSL